MPEHTKLSQTRKVAASGKRAQKTSTQKIFKGRHWARAMIAVLVILGVMAAVLWQYRYTIVEHQLRKRLNEFGLNVELDIAKIDGKSALIRGVEVFGDDKTIANISEVELQYEFKRVLKGQFDKVIIHNPVLNLTMGEDGKLVGFEALEFPQNQDGATPKFPAQGIVLKNGVLNWHVPFGHGATNIDLDVKSLTQWTLSLDGPGTTLIHDGMEVKFDIHGNLEQLTQTTATAVGSITARKLNTPQLRAQNTKLDFNMGFTKSAVKNIGESIAENIDVKGWLQLAGDQLDTDIYAANALKLKLDVDTVFDLESLKFTPSTTHWQGESTGVKMKDPAQRLALSRTLGAYDGMIAAPITMHFADDLPQKFAQLLANFDMSGEGDFIRTGNGYEMRLSDTLLLQGEDQSLHITSTHSYPLTYISDTQNLRANIDVQWTGDRAMRLKNVYMQARSNDGIRIDEMQALTGRFISEAAWEKHVHEDVFSLAPFDVSLSYTQIENTRSVRLSGDIDYDGLVPGGRVERLRAAGMIAIIMRGDAFTLGFTPSQTIQMQSFENQSGWLAENIEFSLNPSKELMTTRANGRALTANLSQLSAQILSPEKDRHLDMKIERVQAKTLFAGFPQDWDIMMENLQINSEDFPSPGTRIVSENSELQVRLTQNGQIEFVSKNPSTHIETANVRMPQIAIDLSGSPDDFMANYDAQNVEFIGGDIPKLPMRGTARLNAGELTGQAVTDLPLTQDTPIDMAFRSVDGRGTVDINIPLIEFSPSGLQPQHLIPSLRGKLAEVTGPVSATFHFAFGGGGPIQSHGTTNLHDLDIGTLVGPLKGVNTQLTFSSIFPLKTDGVQSLTMAGFDPGLPMENGALKFEIIPNGIRIDEAIWPVENTGVFADQPAGKIYIAPMVWRFGDVVNQASVHIENIELGTLLEKIGKENLNATGQVNGVLPARIKGVSLDIKEGFLEIKDGGVIQLKAPGLNAAGTRNEYAGHAVKALENFTYKKLEAHLNGPLDGEVQLNMEFEGNNPDVLNGQSFLFNAGVKGELANIVRNLSKSFSNQENLNRILEVGKIPEN